MGEIPNLSSQGSELDERHLGELPTFRSQGSELDEFHLGEIPILSSQGSELDESHLGEFPTLSFQGRELVEIGEEGVQSDVPRTKGQEARGETSGTSIQQLSHPREICHDSNQVERPTRNNSISEEKLLCGNIGESNSRDVIDHVPEDHVDCGTHERGSRAT